MPNKIDTVDIVRDREHDRENDVHPTSNADYVTELDKSTSIMPPEKPFEKDVAQDNSNVKENETSKNELFAQQTREKVYEIERSDQTVETKLHLLKIQYEKATLMISQGGLAAKDRAALSTLIRELEKKLSDYRAKNSSGGKPNMLAIPILPEDEDGEGLGNIFGFFAKDRDKEKEEEKK